MKALEERLRGFPHDAFACFAQVGLYQHYRNPVGVLAPPRALTMREHEALDPLSMPVSVPHFWGKRRLAVGSFRLGQTLPSSGWSREM